MPPRLVWAVALIILAGWLDLWLTPTRTRPGPSKLAPLTLIQGGKP